MGGAKSQPVVAITSADLKANGGQYKLTGKYALKVNGNDSLSVMGGAPAVVYPVSQAQIASGEFELIQGQAVDVTQVTGRGRESGAWAMPVYHAGPGTWPPNGGTGCDDLDPEYCAVEALFSAIPSDTWRDAGSDWFIATRTALSIATLNQAFDFLYLLCNENADDALINLANPGTHDAINVNSAAFEESRGYTSNGTTSYLNTQFNPATQGVNYLQNSASLGVYVRNNIPGAAQVDIGARHSVSSRQAWIVSRTNDMAGANATGIILNQNSAAVSAADTVLDSRGLFITSRTASNAVGTYRNGTIVGSATTASSTPPDFGLYVCAMNNNGSPLLYSTRQQALAFASRGMNATEISDFYAATQAFMTAIGAQV